MLVPDEAGAMFVDAGGAARVMDAEAAARLEECADYDVFVADGRGTAHRCYSDTAEDNTIVVTPQCNSNCVMCPSAERFRREEGPGVEHLARLVRHIPTDARHLTITGGEPFLIGRDIFTLLGAMRERFERTEFLLLTNGRALAIPDYVPLLERTLPSATLIGIPLHGPDADLHDSITRAHGSFRQTCAGLRRLLARGFSVEIRVVVGRMNADRLLETARIILDDFPEARCVRLVGLEMLGNAAANEKKVWLSYDEAFRRARPAILELVRGGIDVSLYNFPLCAVDPGFWPLCCASISQHKVRFAEQCALCAVRDACGGLFAGTYRLAKDAIRPIAAREGGGNA